MGFCCEGEIFIPQEEWQEFVMKYLPNTGAYVHLGPVSFKGGDMSVLYALNTECHPTEQRVPPSWLRKGDQQ